jgi:hypothetical protein
VQSRPSHETLPIGLTRGENVITDLTRTLQTVIVILLMGFEACDINSPDPPPPQHAPVIESFSPTTSWLQRQLGETVVFSVTAIDPDNDPLSYRFLLADSSVAQTSQWRYTVSETGAVTVTARVSDGSFSQSVEWQLDRRPLPPPPPPPPDTARPDPVSVVLAERGGRIGDRLELIVRWIAVGDDGMKGRPDHYDLRYSAEPIEDEDDWSTATPLPAVASSVDAGGLEWTVTHTPIWFGARWVAVRAVDDAGNRSNPGNTLAARSDGMNLYGTVRDRFTGAPIPGIFVTVDGIVTTTTGVDGRYSIVALLGNQSSFVFRDEFDPVAHGSYFDVAFTRSVNGGDIVDAALVPNVVLETAEYPDVPTWFGEMSKTMNEPPDPLADNRLRTWVLPIAIYVPPFVHNNLDYERTVKDVLSDWESWLDWDLFELVDDTPDVGVRILYSSTTSREHYDVPERDGALFPVKGRVWLRTIWDDTTADFFKRVIAHEVGHVLGMGHSTDSIHLMVGGSAQRVSEPSADEIWLGKMMYHLPRGTYMDSYVWE